MISAAGNDHFKILNIGTNIGWLEFGPPLVFWTGARNGPRTEISIRIHSGTAYCPAPDQIQISSTVIMKDANESPIATNVIYMSRVVDSDAGSVDDVGSMLGWRQSLELSPTASGLFSRKDDTP